MSARPTLPVPGIIGALMSLQLLPIAALAEDRRPDAASLSVMTINTYFMWDGVAPEDGSSQIDIPWRNSQLRIPKQAGHLFRIDVGHRSDLIPARVPR